MYTETLSGLFSYRFNSHWRDECRYIEEEDDTKFEYTGSWCARSGTNISRFGEYVFGLINLGNIVFYTFSDNLREYTKRTHLISDLADLRLSLKEFLPVEIEYDGIQFIVYSQDLDEFSSGPDEPEAINEFKQSVVDIYFLLKEENDNLGPLPQIHWNYLRRIIEEN